MSLAYLASSRSADPRTKVGAVVVFDDDSYVSGYNGCPRGFADSILSTPDKHLAVIHAEANALSYAGLEKCLAQKKLKLYVTFKPCPLCALKLVQHNIKEVIYHTVYQSTVNDDRILDTIRHNGLRRGNVFRRCRFKLRQYHGPLLFSHSHCGINSK